MEFAIGGAAVGTFAFAWPGIGFGVVAGVEHPLDIFFAKRLDGGFLVLGWGDRPDDVVLDDVLFDGPGPGRGEGDVAE